MTNETATFGAGCFWGVEWVFHQVPGVVEAVSGFSGTDFTPAEQAYLTAYQGMIDAANSLGESALDDYQKAEETDKTLKRKSIEKTVSTDRETRALTTIVPMCGWLSKPQKLMCSMRSDAGPTGQPAWYVAPSSVALTVATEPVNGAGTSLQLGLRDR